MGVLNVSAVATRLRWSPATAKRRVAAWFGAQATHPRVPRVSLERTGGRGRPGYVVDEASLSAWCRNGVAADDARPARSH